MDRNTKEPSDNAESYNGEGRNACTSGGERIMREIALPFAIGALCGSRTMLGPACVGQHAVPRHVHHVVLALAAGELIVDKSSRIRNRTDALPLIARIAMGALSGAASVSRARGRAAVLGALGALGGSFGWFHLRRIAARRFAMPNVVAGLVEDAVAVGMGAMIVRRYVQ